MNGIKLLNAAVTAALCLLCIGITAVLLCTEPVKVPSGEAPLTDPSVSTAASVNTAPSDSAAAPVFRGTAEDFIACYNGLYCSDRGEICLPSLEDWRLFPDKVTPRLGLTADRYEFDPDESIHNEPTISLYVQSTLVREVWVVLPEHDWTQWRHDMFLEQCRYALLVFFPELTRGQLDDLTATALEEARSVSVPVLFYTQMGVDCYAYTENGLIRIGIVPLSEKKS